MGAWALGIWECKYDTDGNRIFIDELKVGDQVAINETGYVMIMRVLQTA